MKTDSKMSVFELLLIGAIAYKQELIFAANPAPKELSDEDLAFLDLGDVVISSAGFGPKDWDNVVSIPSATDQFDYYHVSRESLN